MLNSGIRDGDLLAVHATKVVRNNQIVVARLDDEVTVKRFKKTGTSVKSKSANRNHILTKQTTKRKRHNRGLNKLKGTVLKMASRLINR